MGASGRKKSLCKRFVGINECSINAASVSIETKLVDVENGKQTTVVMLKIKNQEYDEHQGKIAPPSDGFALATFLLECLVNQEPNCRER